MAKDLIRAAKLVFEYGIGSTAILQCYMNIRINKAESFLNQLAALEIVGPENNARPREVLIKSQLEFDNIIKNI